MKQASFYHKDTGMLSPTHMTASDERAIALNTPADHMAIEGLHDHMRSRFDIASGKIIDYQPPSPSVDHEWNSGDNAWTLKPEVAAKQFARQQALVQIAALESSQHRAIREATLGMDGAKERLQKIEDEITTLRGSL